MVHCYEQICLYNYVCIDPVCFEEPESVRLVDGVSEGRVEVCHHSNQYRRGVCDSNWDDKDAYVTCKELKLLTNDKSEFI